MNQSAKFYSSTNRDEEFFPIMHNASDVNFTKDKTRD